MGKKIVAVTGIKSGDYFVAAGDTLDAAKFSKEELKELHDNGAIAIEDDAKPEDVKAEEAPAAAGPDTSAPTAPVAPKTETTPAKK